MRGNAFTPSRANSIYVYTCMRALHICIFHRWMRIQYQLVSPASMETQLANAWNIGRIELYKQEEWAQ